MVAIGHSVLPQFFLGEPKLLVLIGCFVPVHTHVIRATRPHASRRRSRQDGRGSAPATTPPVSTGLAKSASPEMRTSTRLPGSRRLTLAGVPVRITVPHLQIPVQIRG